MREFFKPWRRKAGVVTLVMACVLLTLWGVNQQIEFGYGIETTTEDGWTLDFGYFQQIIFSGPGITLSTWCLPEGFGLNDDGWYWRKNKNTSYIRSIAEGRKWTCCGFAFGEGPGAYPLQRMYISIYTIPHWSVILPVSLLAAYLLLSKPRAPKLPVNQPI